MKTAIITDSNSGIFAAEAKKRGLYTVSMPVLIEDETYYEGENLSHEEFYRMLEEGRSVATSQPSPASVTAVWDRALADGAEEIVYIPMSAGLSGSVQTAKVLAEDYRGRVCVVDNRRISVTQRHAVRDAVRLRESGLSAAQIQERLEETARLSLVYVGVQNLEYLKRGGRVTPAAAGMALLLNLKPLLEIRGDKLDAYAKVRGTVPCMRREIEAMQAFARELRARDLPIRVSAAGSFANEKDAKAWHAMVKEGFPGEKVNYDPLTFSVSCHVGAGAFGMGISVKL